MTCNAKLVLRPLEIVALAAAPPATVRVNEALARPEPVRGTTVGEEGSELTTMREELRDPACVGENLTCSTQLWPGARLVAQGAVTLKSPETLVEIALNGDVPVLVRVNARFADAPTTIDPNARLDGVSTAFEELPTPVNATVSGRVVADVANASEALL